MQICRILVVEDYEPLRRLVCSLLQLNHLQVVGEASDGLEAVQNADLLQPDLIILDLSLPKLNGLEAARQLQKVAPEARIIFLSDETSPEVASEAFNLGAAAYIHKLQTYNELLPAIERVLRRKQAVAQHPSCRHEMILYSDHDGLLKSFSDFVVNAMKSSRPALVIATPTLLDGILQTLTTEGFDVAGALSAKTLVAVDVYEVLSSIMVDGSIDPIRARNGSAVRLEEMARVANGARIAACGIVAPTLWEQGKKHEAALLEELWDELLMEYEIDSLCAYSVHSFVGDRDNHHIRSISDRHSAVYSQ
jgi:DNA-binding NarL/FixJ family response regulator